jgi:hypothetical protein
VGAGPLVHDYEPNVEGQYLPLTGLRPGRYTGDQEMLRERALRSTG